MDEAQLNELSKRIVGGAFQVMNTLGVGFLESVYLNALAHELRKNGLKAETRVPIEVRYDDVRVGLFEAGLIVESTIIVEIRCVNSLEGLPVAMALNHLKATGKPLCLLFNFNQPRIEIKRLRFG